MEPRRRFTARNVALQCVGVAVSVGLMVWVVSRALTEENAAALERLRDAEVWVVGVLVLATVGNIAANGLIFHAVARPEFRLSPVYLVFLNALQTLLASLPFKLGVLIRGVIHHRRDGVPFRLIVGWFTAVGALGMATLVPIAVVGVLRVEADVVYGAAVLGVFVLAHVGAVVMSRLSARETASGRALARASLGSWRFLRHPSAVLGHAGWRALDLVFLSLRFYAGGLMVGVELLPQEALLLGTAFFFLSVTAPAGNIGIREAGTVGLAAALGVGEGAMAVLALVVSATEFGVAFVLSLPAVAVIGPRRVLGGRHGGTEARRQEGADREAEVT